MSFQEKLQQVADLIMQSETIAICSHISPDGDTLGTGNALRLGLTSLGKKVAWFDQDAVPKYLQLIPGWEACRQPESLRENEHFDLLLCEDISDASRMGRCSSLMDRCGHSAQIDHHATNPVDWTEYAAVDGSASACAVVAFKLLKLLGVSFTQDMVTSLYVGIATDTGSFAYSITSDAFAIVGELVTMGLNVPTLHRALFQEKEVPSVKLLGRALSSMQFSENGKVTVLRTTFQDYADCEAGYTNAETIVNHGLNIEGVCATAHLKAVITPEGESIIKASFRSIRPYDIAAVAAIYGGGGHTQAAGAVIRNKDMDTAASEIMQALLKAVAE